MFTSFRWKTSESRLFKKGWKIFLKILIQDFSIRCFVDIHYNDQHFLDFVGVVAVKKSDRIPEKKLLLHESACTGSAAQ